MLPTSRHAKEKTVEELLLKNYNQYYRLACSYTHNESDASDIVQNGAYKAIKNSEQLKNIDFAATWLYRIMINEIFQFYREQRKNSYDEIPEELQTEDTYEDFDLKRALEELPEKDQLIIKLKYFEEMKLEDIADVTNENLNTVKSRLYRGIRKLRLTLKDDLAFS